MIALRKRGNSFHMDLLMGQLHAVRGSLGTRNHGAALRVVHRIEIALAEGPRSSVWAELKPVIPGPTFARLAQYAGIEGRLILTWNEFRDNFESYQEQQVKEDELARNTVDNYRRTLNEFDEFLRGEHIEILRDIDDLVIDKFKPWRTDRIKTRKSNGASMLHLDLIHLHHVFAFAVDKRLIEENPVRVKAKRQYADGGYKPYTADEARALLDHAGDDLLLHTLLYRTGFRRSDAAILRWGEVSLERQEIVHTCVKNRRIKHGKVTLPVLPDLFAILDAERQRRNPQPGDYVLLDPSTGRPFDNPHLASNSRDNGIYERIRDLGRRAGVHKAHPHRYRSTYAIDMLIRTDNVVYVAMLLGDTVQTVTKSYLPFVRELRERARFKIDHGMGIEQFETPASQKKATAAQAVL
jgi:site-specific recombinase XerD